MPHVLTLNAGSSSINFASVRDRRGDPTSPNACVVKSKASAPRHGLQAASPERAARRTEPLDPATSRRRSRLCRWTICSVAAAGDFDGVGVGGVGHRGSCTAASTSANPSCSTAGELAVLERLVSLAPLHQPHNLAGVRAAQAAFPQAMQVACFDTAFHRTHPLVNDTFALPRKLLRGRHPALRISRPVLRISSRTGSRK